jgi:hypothetical protein
MGKIKLVGFAVISLIAGYTQKDYFLALLVFGVLCLVSGAMNLLTEK